MWKTPDERRNSNFVLIYFQPRPCEWLVFVCEHLLYKSAWCWTFKIVCSHWLNFVVLFVLLDQCFLREFNLHMWLLTAEVLLLPLTNQTQWFLLIGFGQRGKLIHSQIGKFELTREMFLSAANCEITFNVVYKRRPT